MSLKTLARASPNLRHRTLVDHADFVNGRVTFSSSKSCSGLVGATVVNGCS